MTTYMEKRTLITPETFNNEYGLIYTPIFSNAFEKYASDFTVYVPEKIQECISKLKPRHDGRYVHVIALGAGEYFGPNRKHDYFPEKSLLGMDLPADIEVKYKNAKIKIPSKDEYGLITFEKYGYPFRNHNNKHPRHTTGEKVVCAAYNMKMHRVEVIVFISKHLAPDIVKRIDEGDNIPWSMGCRVSADRCNACQHLAKTTNYYCDHARFHMGEFINGTRVYVINDYPKFFDISHVNVPADRTAWMISKVASFEKQADYAPKNTLILKTSGMKKINDIKKTVPLEGETKNLGEDPLSPKETQEIKNKVDKDKKEDINPESLDRLKRIFGGADSIKALTSGGIILKPKEVTRIFPDGFERPRRGLRGMPSGIMDIISKFLPGRSMFGGFFGPRVAPMRRISITIIRKADPKSDVEEQEVSKEEAKTASDYYSWLSELTANDFKNILKENDVAEHVIPQSFSEKVANIYVDTGSFNILKDFYLPFKLELEKIKGDL